jgi:hypothetical protein
LPALTLGWPPSAQAEAEFFDRKLALGTRIGLRTGSPWDDIPSTAQDGVAAKTPDHNAQFRPIARRVEGRLHAGGKRF